MYTNDSLISIIIPVYNSEKTIERCIMSCFNQSYKNIEVIAVDDGSTDDSLAILNKIKKEDSRLTVISKENGGVSSARNVGINRANGDYISFVDSDDTIECDMIEYLYNNAMKYKCELSICNYSRIYDKNIKFKSHIKDGEVLLIDSPEDFIKKLNIYEGFLCNKLFVTKLVKKIRLDESVHFCEDELFILEYIEKVNKCCYTDIPLYNYYIYSNSGSSWKDWNEKKVSVVDAREKILKILSKYDFSVYKNSYIYYFDLLNEIYHNYSAGDKFKFKLGNAYKTIMKNHYSFKEKIICSFKYNFYNVFNFIKKIYNFFNGRKIK